MEEVGRQRPRQTPIQCWGCQGDHKYRYCPHKNGKVRVDHNVQQAEIVEDMRVEYQGYMYPWTRSKMSFNHT
jgi:hypothetical protein